MSGGAGSAAGRESSAGLAPQPTIDEHCRRRPAEPLRPSVAHYTGYRQRGVPPARHRGLPSPFLTLIVTLDEPLVLLAHPDPRQPPGPDLARAGPAPAPEVRWAWRQLLASGGAIRITDLAAETGWSGHHLTSRFRTEIGLTPKAAARVIRFDRARHLLVRHAADDGYRLADLAAACGYFDQAHLAREFRSLAGCPPSQWLTEEVSQRGRDLAWTEE